MRYPPGADEIPAQYRSAGGTWYGFAARARVLEEFSLRSHIDRLWRVISASLER